MMVSCNGSRKATNIAPYFLTTVTLCVASVAICSLLIKIVIGEKNYNGSQISFSSTSRSLLDGADSNKDLAVATVVFSLCGFIGNFGVALTGFGMAIFFLFVYTIADVIGLMDCSRCGIKDAVFYQSLALAAAVPVLFYKARKIFRKNLDKPLLLTFIPATVAGTPVGKYLQEDVDNNMVKVIVGGIVSGVLCYELYKILVDTEWFKNKYGDKEEEVNNGENDDSPGNGKRRTRASILDPRAVRNSCESAVCGGEMVTFEDDTDNADDISPIADNSPDEEAASTDQEKHDGSKAQAKRKKIAKDGKGALSLKDFVEESKRQLSGDVIPSGPALYIFGFIFGFLSGFLGGLIGIRGPPLIIFFLHFPYPKPIVKANSMLIMLTNVGIRIVYYIIEDLSGARETSWFDADLWYLYISVMAFGVLGVPVGHWVSKKLDQQQFKMVIAFMLLLSGLSSLIKGGLDLSRA